MLYSCTTERGKSLSIRITRNGFHRETPAERGSHWKKFHTRRIRITLKNVCDCLLAFRCTIPAVWSLKKCGQLEKVAKWIDTIVLSGCDGMQALRESVPSTVNRPLVHSQTSWCTPVPLSASRYKLHALPHLHILMGSTGRYLLCHSHRLAPVCMRCGLVPCGIFADACQGPLSSLGTSPATKEFIVLCFSHINLDFWNY